MHKQQGWPQAWEYCQAKPIQTLGRASQGVNWSWSQCIKSHHSQTSSGKALPSHFWNRNIVRSILPGLRRKRTGLLLSGPKSSFQMKVHLEIKVPESVGRVERHIIHVASSPVWSLQSVIIWAAMSSAGVGSLCFLKSTVPLRELELRRKRYGERHQRCPALNHMCNQSKLMARRQVRVTSWPGCLKARDMQPASAFCHSAKLSVCVSHVYVLWVSYYRLSKKDRK